MKDIYAPLWLAHYITEGLVQRGHQVTLFAPNNSKTKAKLVSNGLVSLAQNKKYQAFYVHQYVLTEETSYRQSYQNWQHLIDLIKQPHRS